MKEKYSVDIEVEFSKDGKNRFYLKKIWNENKPIVMIIMNAPGNINGITQDLTTCVIINNLYKNYGGVIICNLYPKIGFSISKDIKVSASSLKKNDEYIARFASEVDKVILAVGSLCETNKKVGERQKKLLGKLATNRDKIYVICDANGKGKYSPLYPRVRNNWNLKKVEELDEPKE